MLHGVWSENAPVTSVVHFRTSRRVSIPTSTQSEFPFTPPALRKRIRSTVAARSGRMRMSLRAKTDVRIWVIIIIEIIPNDYVLINYLHYFPKIIILIPKKCTPPPPPRLGSLLGRTRSRACTSLTNLLARITRPPFGNGTASFNRARTNRSPPRNTHVPLGPRLSYRSIRRYSPPLFWTRLASVFCTGSRVEVMLTLSIQYNTI